MNQDAGLPFAADTPQAPWNQPQLDPRDRTKIDSLADEFAADCFDRRYEPLRQWLLDEGVPPVFIDFFFATIHREVMPNDDEASLSLSAEVDKLREKFVSESAQLFRAEAEREIMETAEEES